MRSRSRNTWVAFALAAVAAAPVVGTARYDTAVQTDAAKLKNPVAADAKSIGEGKKLYGAQCASCHGLAGKGDGKGGALLKPLPADFTDDTWKHGSGDGDIFVVIRDGIKQTGMRAFGGRLTTQEIWHLVNYLRTLGPKPAKAQ